MRVDDHLHWCRYAIATRCQETRFRVLSKQPNRGQSCLCTQDLIHVRSPLILLHTPLMLILDSSEYYSLTLFNVCSV